MTPASRWIYATTFILAASGFLLPLWPLCLVGLFIAALSGRWLFAVFVGLLLDIAWGAPTGTARYLIFPFTIVALFAVVARFWGGRYFIDRNAQERL